MMLFAIALGGAIGSVARYLVVSQMTRWLGVAFPWGTLTVNVAGGLVIGLLAEAMALKWSVSPELRAFVIVGILGGFTTFSSFSLDVISLAQNGAVGTVFVYVFASVVLSVAAAFVGLMLMRWMLG